LEYLPTHSRRPRYRISIETWSRHRWTPCSDLDQGAIKRFFCDGFIALRGFFAADLIRGLADEASRRLVEDEERELAGRAHGRVAFERTARLWERSPALRALTFDGRLARVVCDLLHVDGVRVIGDDVFHKPVGSRVTSWHCDQSFLPIDRDQFISAWIPFHAVDADCGALVYGVGTHHRRLPDPHLAFRGESLHHLWFSNQLRLRGVRRATIAAAPGDVLLHHGRTLHMAHRNRSDAGRLAFGIHYVDVRSRFVRPMSQVQREHVETSDWMQLQPGDEIDVATAPIAFHRS
jgi:hypothetical protein